MSEIVPKNHLKNAFYTTPKLARQMMTTRQYQETSLATEGRILSCGETWILQAEYRGGGMQEVSAEPTYWTDSKPKRAKQSSKA